MQIETKFNILIHGLGKIIKMLSGLLSFYVLFVLMEMSTGINSDIIITYSVTVGLGYQLNRLCQCDTLLRKMFLTYLMHCLDYQYC
jgi:hypothetical protein